MRLLMISMDRNILDQDSAVNGRMVEYGTLFEELHIVIFSRMDLGLSSRKIAPNIWVYPTNSLNRWFYVFDAVKIGRKVLLQLFFGETVITADDPYGTGIVGVILKFLFKFPLQIQLHTDAWSYYYRYANVLNWIRTTIISPFILRYADGIRVVSEKIRQDVILLGKIPDSKVSVLPIFVDTEAFSRSVVTKNLHDTYPKWKTIILMTSRLMKEKDIPLALKVFRRLAGRYKDVGLVIVGSGEEESHLKHLVSRFKLNRQVIFESWQLDLTSYFKTTDIFLNTSRYEGYGMSLVEAGASGCPIVTTRVGVAFDMLDDGNNALVCEVGDEMCLYTKLVTLIENPTIRRLLGDEVKKVVLSSTISKEMYLQKSKQLFDQLCKK